MRKAVDCNMSSSSFIMSHTKRTWGAGHISTLDMVNNIGLLYGNQGKVEEAEAMYLRALQGKGEGVGSGAHIDARDGKPQFCIISSSRAPPAGIPAPAIAAQ